MALRLMARAHRSYGRPGTDVVPVGWGASHAPVVAGTRNAVVTLRHAASAPAWDADARATTSTAGAPYASNVTARIQFLGTRGDHAQQTAEETVDVAPYLVQVDHDQPCREGDLVDVATCPGDATLAGRTLLVGQVNRGTDRFGRDLLCTLVDD